MASRTHIFTVDVEEWFQVSAFDAVVRREEWGSLESRVDATMDRLLGLLAESGSRGTFFVLGWLAERRPHVVRRIVEAGHEVASHGWSHHRLTTLTPAQFRQDVRDARAELERIAGTAVTGYRAPSFSLVPGLEWAFDVLLEEGYRYDSSLFPIRRPGGYGYASAPLHPFRIERPSGVLLEVPLSPARVLGARVPACGGAYFRHFPYALTRLALRQAEAEGRSGVFYIHPWELDPGQPRLAVSAVTRARHYGNLRRTVPRLERMLTEFQFGTMSEALRIQAALAAAAGGSQ